MDEHQTKKRLRGVRFLCERYGRAYRTIDRWIESGDIPKPLRIRGLRYWDEAELDAFDAARASKAEAS
jgi:predicted DNA-binding transcriptional regulator AlpA